MKRFDECVAAVVGIVCLAGAAAAADPPRKVEGNRPRPTAARDDGRIVLLPDAAEFFGETIRINPDNQCIAWWEKPADYVAWEIESPKAAEYEVWLEWAISDELAGNAFKIRVGEASLAGTIGKSGGWTSLKRVMVGKVKLPAGKARLEMKVEGKLKGELADVRAITLNPVGGTPPPATPEVAPRTPASSLNGIRVHPSMQVELVAAEPLVRDPIAIAWAADLKLWVAEMGDYPLGTDGKGGHGGRVRFLEDADGDGHYDRSTVFLDDLSFPTGVLPWRKGVLVSAAPEIFYAEDTDGDGRADLRRPILRGFPERNQQHRVNGLRLGLDGWVYCGNGDGGVGGETTIESVATGQKLALGSHDLRFRPDTGELEVQSGPTQFGRNPDDRGNWFGSNNAQPLYHFALDDHYLARNPRLAAPDPRVHLCGVQGPFFTRALAVSVRGEKTAAGPRSVGMGGACSGMIYRDDLLGPAFAGNAFVCDPVTNLVHRRVLIPDRSSYRGTRAPDESTSEFFTSDDPWTRPVMVQAGPDGALYVVDMYRFYIEHPEWFAASVLASADLRAGSDRGRIYRIYPRDGRPRRPTRLDTAEATELVAALDSPSGWQRDTASRLLAERGDAAAVPALEQLAAAGKRTPARLHALATLAALEAASDERLTAAMRDADPAVRRLAVRLAEPRLAGSQNLVAAVIGLARDADPQVRVQVAATLGESCDPQCGEVLADMLLADRDDRHLVVTALSSATPHARQLLARGLQADPPVSPDLLTQIVSACATPEVDLALLATAELASPRLAGSTARRFSTAAALLRASLPAAEREQLVASLAATCTAARDVLARADIDEAEKVAAIGLVGWEETHRAADLDLLAEQLVPSARPAVAAAAIDRLARIAGPRAGEILVERCGTIGPALGSRAVQTVLARDEWARLLLDRVAADPRLAGLLDPARRQQLLRHRIAEIKQAAERLFGAAARSDRNAVIAEYAAAIGNGSASLARGREVFASQCAGCHRLENIGNAVGPHLASLKGKSPQVLLEAILDPNRAVEDKFIAATIVLEDGRSLVGLVQAESGNSITLVNTDGQQQVVRRSEIETLATTGRSLMPEGFEKAIPPEGMRDLVAFVLQSVAPAAEQDGRLELAAAEARLEGPKVGINRDAGCIAWMTEEDEAAWTLDLREAGEFDVEIEWAQIDELGGNPFVLDSGAGQLHGEFPSTHGWQIYATRSFGTIRLAPGRSTLTLRPAGMVKTELADIRRVVLTRRRGS